MHVSNHFHSLQTVSLLWILDLLRTGMACELNRNFVPLERPDVGLARYLTRQNEKWRASFSLDFIQTFSWMIIGEKKFSDRENDV